MWRTASFAVICEPAVAPKKIKVAEVGRIEVVSRATRAKRQTFCTSTKMVQSDRQGMKSDTCLAILINFRISHAFIK
jgi:hypothetical protein